MALRRKAKAQGPGMLVEMQDGSAAGLGGGTWELYKPGKVSRNVRDSLMRGKGRCGEGQGEEGGYSQTQRQLNKSAIKNDLRPAVQAEKRGILECFCVSSEPCPPQAESTLLAGWLMPAAEVAMNFPSQWHSDILTGLSLSELLLL